MKSLFIFLGTLLIGASSALGFEKTFFNEADVPADISSVEIYLYDMARTELGCSDNQCYRIDVVLNGVQVARWAASPGNPNNTDGFQGVNTPAYNGRSLDMKRIMGSGYVSSRGDAMPYAMFILGSSGQATGFALHAGHVTGRKESHGCIRLEYANAQQLNAWIKEVKANKGSAKIWAEHTTN